MNLSLKFALFTSLMCLTLIGVISYLSYRVSYTDLEDRVGERLEAVVRSGAIVLDGSLHEQILTKEDETSEAFIQLRDYLRQLKSANALKEEIYTFRRINDKMMYVVMTHDQPFVGDTYSLRQDMLPTLEQGIAGRTGVYGDEHGRWLSAYAPIRDKTGQVVGLLEADIRMEEFTAMLQEEYLNQLPLFGILALVSIVLSFLLASTMTRRLNQLILVTERISLGQMDTVVEVKGNDEIAKLASALERMRESLKIAAQMFH